jgi:hypothetical protein
MGDVRLSSSWPANRAFSAGQLFDPQSTYGRMRASMKPEAKLRGFFHHQAVLAKQRAGSGRRTDGEPSLCPAWPPGVRTLYLAITTADPGRELPVEPWPEQAGRSASKRQLLLAFRLRDAASFPGATSSCRALLLTPGMVARLAGVEAVRSPEATRKALLRLFSGQGGDPFETARILAAVPELDGEVDEAGFCRFAAVELPEQAASLEGLPEQTTVLIVIDRPRQG